MQLCGVNADYGTYDGLLLRLPLRDEGANYPTMYCMQPLDRKHILAAFNNIIIHLIKISRSSQSGTGKVVERVERRKSVCEETNIVEQIACR